MPRRAGAVKPAAAAAAAAGSDGSDRSAPAAASASAVSAFAGVSFPAQWSGDLTGENTLHFMLRAIFLYLNQFGMHESAKALREEISAFHEGNPLALNAHDHQEGKTRLEMYRVFTLCSEAAPLLFDSADTVLDALNFLASLCRMPRTADSDLFQTEVLLRACAILSVLRDEGVEEEMGMDRDKLFQRKLDQYLPRADGEGASAPGQFRLLCTPAEASSIQARLEAGDEARVSDLEMRRHRLYQLRAQLEQYGAAKRSRPTAAAAKSVTAKQLSRVDEEYSREALRSLAHRVLFSMIATLKMEGAVLLESIANSLLTHGRYDVPPRPGSSDDEDEEQDEVEAVQDEVEEEMEVEEEVEEEEEEVEEEVQPVPTKAGRPRKPAAPPAPVQKPASKAPKAKAKAAAKVAEEEEEEEDEVLVAVEDEAEEEEESKSAPSSAPPAPVVAALPRRKPGRPSKAEMAARAAAAAAAAAAAEPTVIKPRRAAAASPAAVPTVARDLAAASARLKGQGHDPLADALAATQSLSKKRKSGSRQEHEEEERKESDEQEEEIEEIEEEDEEPQPPPRKRGRPAAAAAAAGSTSKYDREDRSAEKITFSDEEGAAAAAGGDGEEDDDEPVVLPEFTSTKKRTLIDKVQSAAAATPARSQLVAPSSFDSSDQRKRPAVHRHATDRSVRRVPWSAEEIAKLTEGVVEFAAERKKWSLILQKYGEFFMDRTVVDLKDKWRNLKGKLGAASGSATKRKPRSKPAEDDEEMEEIED